MPTVADAINDYMLACRHLSGRTTEWYEQKLTTFAAWCAEQGVTEVADLRAAHLRIYQEAVTATRSTFTVRGYAQVVKTWGKWLADEDYLDVSPFARVKRPKLPQTTIETFSRDQIPALLAACDGKTSLGIRDRAILLFLLDTGLRASEFCALRLEHLHVEREPWVEVAWQTSKGHKARELGLGNATVRMLGRYLRLSRPHLLGERVNPSLWLSLTGGALTRGGLDQVIHRLNRHAGVTGVRVSAHTFRHTFATQFLRATGDIYRLSKVMGHASVSVTENYLRSLRARDARCGWVSPADAMLG